MRDDCRGQVPKGVEVLDLTRPHNGQQAFDRALAVVAARAKHDFPPLSRVPDYAECCTATRDTV
jgi:hypothetical protein